MKEIPILMKGEMVLAILEGRKTQTRRIITSRTHPAIQEALTQCIDLTEKDGVWQLYGDAPTNYGGETQMNEWRFDLPCPYGKKEDSLWVRETFLVGTDGRPVFRAGIENTCPSDWKWKPSIFMLRRYCRVLLEITDIRVERLQDITAEDAKAEGVTSKDCSILIGEDSKGNIKPVGSCEFVPGQPFSAEPLFHTERAAYATLWQSINGKTQPWEINPWVWVVEFKRVES